MLQIQIILVQIKIIYIARTCILPKLKTTKLKNLIINFEKPCFILLGIILYGYISEKKTYFLLSLHFKLNNCLMKKIICWHFHNYISAMKEKSCPEFYFMTVDIAPVPTSIHSTVPTIENVYYVEGPSPVQSRLSGWSYLIKFSIRNLSYSPCSEPSRTVLLPDVIYTMYARHLS